jgi:Fe-S-cluster containining protein
MPECKKCGECCRVIVVFYSWNAESEDFFRARGLYLETDGETLIVHIPHKCAMLQENRCRLHDGQAKPAICRRFPQGQGYKLPGCAFATPEKKSGAAAD